MKLHEFLKLTDGGREYLENFSKTDFEFGAVRICKLAKELLTALRAKDITWALSLIDKLTAATAELGADLMIKDCVGDLLEQEIIKEAEPRSERCEFLS